jgi:hypothetical protein
MNNLVDIPWTMVDGDLNVQRLIFQRDHTLLIIREGVIQESRWSYLPSVNSIDMILHDQRVFMNEVFSNGTALILKKDGNVSEFYAFVNANNLPTLNLEEYLRSEIQSIEKKIEGEDPPPITPDDPYAPIIFVFSVVLLLIALIFAT